MQWFKNNQSELRKDHLDHVINALQPINQQSNQQQQQQQPTPAPSQQPNQHTPQHPNTEDVLHHCGTKIILPSTYRGGPRQLSELFRDTMATVRCRGKPDLFITMTCNQNWPDIIDNLKNGQTPNDRPDLVARVFNLKLQSLLDDILKKEIFGKVRKKDINLLNSSEKNIHIYLYQLLFQPVAHIYVVEFQKRGLPHAHILVILDSDDKPRTAQRIDQIVSGTIPSPTENPHLHSMVVKHMLHGPCQSNMCYDAKEGRCLKGCVLIRLYFMLGSD
jgi:hypothetical protein